MRGLCAARLCGKEGANPLNDPGESVLAWTDGYS
ncbi:hypothetical protein LMG28140_03553 [Paraburkholderia metrosideri]|uniref:Uncharacterized protein n=1 Tax=Paraburkholderia metrosideri TaxID=580937 RepID=A0ABM8NRZ2_9BURK|nr:hypothetical protein LMG28140_03553 [Paraburkholderia metrosideri]